MNLVFPSPQSQETFRQEMKQDFIVDPTDLSTTEVIPSVVLYGLRTLHDAGIVETCSMTLRVFYPFHENTSPFDYPEGSMVVVIGGKPQMANLYASIEDLKSQRMGSNRYFLLPITWDRINEYALLEMQREIVYNTILENELLRNPSDVHLSIHRNGMTYFYNATLIWLFYHEGLVLRPQESIYMEIAQQASSNNYFRDEEKRLHFMLLCYMLWVARALHVEVESPPPDMESLLQRLLAAL